MIFPFPFCYYPLKSPTDSLTDAVKGDNLPQNTTPQYTTMSMDGNFQYLCIDSKAGLCTLSVQTQVARQCSALQVLCL